MARFLFRGPPEKSRRKHPIFQVTFFIVRREEKFDVGQKAKEEEGESHYDSPPLPVAFISFGYRFVIKRERLSAVGFRELLQRVCFLESLTATSKEQVVFS